MDFVKHFKVHWKDYLLAFLLVFLFMVLVIGGLGVFSLSSSSKSLSIGSQSYDRVETSYVSNEYYYDSDNGMSEEVRQVIKNAAVDIETEEFDLVKERVQSLVNQYDAVVLRADENSYKDYRRVDYVFKVDSSKVDSFVEGFDVLGEVTSSEIQVDDVTGVVVDYKKKLERYESQTLRYQEMLLKKNLSVEEEVKIQTRLDQLDDSIDFFKSQLSKLNEEVKFSEVRLSVDEKESLLAEVDFLGFRDGFKMFLESIEVGVRFILLVLGFVLPFLVLFGIYKVGRKIIR